MFSQSCLERCEPLGIGGRRTIIAADVKMGDALLASEAACVDLTCSASVMGTAEVCSLRATDPVMATVMMQGGPMFIYPGMGMLLLPSGTL